MKHKIRVVVADDSALMRKKISEILNSDPDIEVIAVVKNGREVIDAVHNLKPDVVTLDVEMPILNGLEALGYIMSEIPTPCVMISAFTEIGTKESIRALEFGAIDFVTKPNGVISPGIEKTGYEIIAKVKIASKIPASKLKLMWAGKAKKVPLTFKNKKNRSIPKLVAIAASTGGTQALATVLPSLTADLPAAILVVQHMPEGFTKTLAERLNWQSKITIVEAKDKMAVKQAQVIIACGGFHMELTGSVDNPYISLNKKSLRLGVRPNADIMMQSAANIFKEKTLGVVLTGMGTDGMLGAKAIKSKGGIVLAEAKTSCVVYGMPKTVFEAGLTDKIVPLHLMAKEIEQQVRQ